MATSIGRPNVPVVSIGVPVFNGADYLDAALRSIQAQTVTDLEIVVVDNGSTDATVDIVTAVAQTDSRIRLLRNETNIGAAGNFNRAFNETSGRYFKWAAHDDVYAPTFVAECLDVLENDLSVAIVYAKTIEIDERGNELSVTSGREYAGSPSVSQRAQDILLRPSPCYEAFGLMRREQLGSSGLIGGYTSSDRVLLLEMAIKGRFVEIPEALFYHRQHMQRSIRAYSNDVNRRAWFDPNARGRAFPSWRLGAEYWKALWSSRGGSNGVGGVSAVWLWLRWAAKMRRRLSREAARAWLGPLAGRGAQGRHLALSRR